MRPYAERRPATHNTGHGRGQLDVGLQCSSGHWLCTRLTTVVLEILNGQWVGLLRLPSELPVNVFHQYSIAYVIAL